LAFLLPDPHEGRPCLAKARVGGTLALMGRNGLIEFLANAQMNRELYEDDAVT
jgi:hypothetical protein